MTALLPILIMAESKWQGDDMPVGDPPNCGPACNCQKTFTAGDVSKSVPAFMPAYLPYPDVGVTVATLDKEGNLTIKVDQPSEPPKPNRFDVDDILRQIGQGRKIDAIKMYRAMCGAPLKDALAAIELAMPVRTRDTPEGIANRIFNDHRWQMSAEFMRETATKMQAAIAAAIRAERG